MKIEGKDKSIQKQLQILKKILKQSPIMMEILTILDNYSKENEKNPILYLSGGSVNQTVFNYYHGYAPEYGIKDYDINYYDADDCYESEDKIIKEVSKRLVHLNVPYDIKNQGRVHLWINNKYGMNRKPYTSMENAVSRWGNSISCIAVTMQNKKLEVICPYGLNDKFSLTVRPIKTPDYPKEIYDKKTKEWKEKWPMLEIKEWDEP